MNTKKNIAFISEHASPLASLGNVDTGGQNVYVAQLAQHLAAKNFHVDIYTRKDSPGQKEVVEWLPGIRVIYIKAGPEQNVIKEEMLPYMQEFQDRMIDFMITEQLHYKLIHANFFMSALVAQGIKKEMNIPFVVTFHALGHIRRLYQAENDKFPIERLKIEEEVIKAADQIIAECPQDRNDLMRYYYAPADKISIVPCGFSSTEFYPIEKTVARKILKLPQDSHIILQLGRMVPRKGIDNAIRSINYLKNKINKPVKLVIVGGDCDNMSDSNCPEYNRLRNIAKELEITENVEFMGKKGRDMLKFYYSAADLFITTPWYEPFGITPLEAMACGTPVIGSAVGGIKFSVLDGLTGALVSPDNPQKLAQKTAEILNAPLLMKQMSENAFKRVNKYFTWAKVANEMIAIYNGLFEQTKTHRLSKRLNDKEFQAA